MLGLNALAMSAVLLAGQAAQTQEHVRLMPQLGIGSISSVAFSPDGRLVLTGGGGDGKARLWDAATGLQIRSFFGYTWGDTSVAYSPDGRFVLTGSSVGGTVRLWDAATGQQIRSFEGHTQEIKSMAFSPDGRFVLTGGEDDTARLWDVATGLQIRSFTGAVQVFTISSVAFSPDGRYILTGDNAETALWNAATGEHIRSFKAGINLFDTVAFSPDGHYVIAGGNDKRMRLWDAATGELIRSFAEDEDKVISIVFSPDGRSVLTGSYNETAWLWDVASGQQIRSFAGHTGAAVSVAFSPDGRFVLTGGLDNTARLWDTATGKQIRTFEGHTGEVWSVAFSSDGRYLLTGSSEASARLWDTASGQQTRSFAVNNRLVSIVAFSPDNRSVLTASGAVSLWDVDTGNPIRSFKDPTGLVYSAAFSRDGRFLLTGSSNWKAQARLWNADTGQSIRTFPEHEESRSFFGHTADLCPVAFSPDGRFVLTGSGGTTVWLWDAATGQQIRPFIGHTGRMVYVVAFSPDSRFVLTGGDDKTARLWDVQSGKELLRFEQPSGSVNSVAFSPTGRYVLTGSDDGIARLWDAVTGEKLHTFEGHTAGISSVSFSPDGRFVLTGSPDTTTRLWDANTGKELATLISFEKGGWAVVDPEGRFDTSDLDGGAPLVWVADSDPMRPLPLEIFMRDYYTPRLLARIMNYEELPEVRSIAEITNRVQPDVSIVSVSASKTHPGRADVVVHAASHTNEKGQSSGLQNLRLFRNGQLVANTPLDKPLESGDFTFTDIQLPTSAKQVTFTAYAFNHDINQHEQIKSATTPPFDFSYEPGPPAKPRAYLLQIGVNHYRASGCELYGSVTDANELSRVLADRLTARGLDVQAVRLISTDTKGGATKQEIHDALQKIAAAATPDDVFFLSFSGHGYGDNRDGQFYIFPFDVQGRCNGVDDAMLRQAISADELAEWLRPIDAGEMTFVLDACHSASSVEANDFKPGPMGSRGLGQLAYDKRIRILAASQSDQAAQESYFPVENGSSVLRAQGLLSYELTREGLENNKADWKPKYGEITVGKWLSYAADAVPKFLVAEAARKSVESGAVKTGRSMGQEDESTPEVKSAQIPAVFDFSKKDTFVLQ
jgi:WD40 repeat protein